MLQKIVVKNYALIEDLELHFDRGLTIVTGETGAGKSILLGALSLLLGQRADTGALLDKSRKCILEAEFNVDENTIKSFFDASDLDIQHPLTLRREISPEGKSRSFINDTPVNLSLLKELGSLLVDIHSQHETLLLNQSGFQLSVVDAFAKNEKELEIYRTKFFEYKKLSAHLEAMTLAEKKSAADGDYYRFQLDELEKASLEDGEQERWEDELRSQSHAEEIKTGLAQAMALASEGDGNVEAGLSSLVHLLQSLSRYHTRLEQVSARVKSVLIETKDIAGELEQIGEEIQFNPARIEWLNDRLHIIYQLQQKHRAASVKQLIEMREEFAGKLEGMDSLATDLAKCKEQTDALYSELTVLAKKISAGRTAVFPKIEKEIQSLLKEVAMPHAVLKIENELLEDDAFAENGADRIRFLFSANKGILYQELSRVASGGELSRLMLCLKSLLARIAHLPTIVFDEIDTGISGETAFKVGKMLREMSGNHQLIAITHLPQIAGRGEAHYFVYKAVTGKKTVTQVRRLTSEERIVEIAKMLSGEKPTAIALENAKELLKN